MAPAASAPGIASSTFTAPRFAITPIDYFYAMMNEVDPVTSKPLTGRDRPSPKRRDQAAIALLPYVHHRLAPVSFEKTKPQPKSHMDLTKLNDDELAFLEHILAKSQVTLVHDTALNIVYPAPRREEEDE